MGEFVIRHIEMTLDPKSIQRAIRIVNSLQKKLKNALDALVKDLLHEGIEIAQIYLELYQTVKNADLRTGDLMGSIRVEMENGKSGKGYLVAGYPGDSNGEYSYAVYVEFGYGTGTYHRLSDGSLITSTSAYERNKEHGNVDKGTGRIKDHPSGRDVYRRIEDFHTITAGGKKFYGWVYQDKRTGKHFISHGQNPKPFMYKTFVSLTKKAETEGPQFIVDYISNGGV